MSRSRIFTTIINPPLVFGVTGTFLFLVLFLLFMSLIFVRAIFGFYGFLLSVIAIGYFYYYGVKKSAKDPFWLNIVIMAFIFERRKPLEFIKRCFTKKNKTFRK